jgi:type I restriction enzyme S subunit
MAQDVSLPAGWKLITLGEIAELSGGGTPSREHPDYFKGDIVWLTPTEIPKNRITVVSNSKEKITQQALKNSSARLLPKGTVLMTSRASIGYVAIAGTEVTTNQGFASFVCKEGIFNYYLAYWLWGNAEYFKQQATGTTFKEIIKSKLRTFTLPLPPLSEQERIVAHIESLFTQLDAGVAGLKRVQAALKRYKASVLKAACEGRLVPQDPSDEPAEELLSRLGKSPLLSKDLPSLPEGWCWLIVEQFNPTNRKCSYGVLQPGNDKPDGILFVRVGDINDGVIDVKNLKRIDPKIAAQYPRTKLQGGEVLITLVGAICRTAVVPNSLTGANTARAVGVIPIYYEFYAPWVELWFRNPERIAEMTSKSHEVARKTLNLEDVRAAKVAFPPLSEQRRIVAEVERQLSFVQELEQIVLANLQRSARLRQVILKRAFEGKLVEQNPEDKPGEALPDEIRATDKTQEQATFKQTRLF